MTIRQLQIFVEAARSGSFVRVADRLHVTPAAISFQIRQLETVSGFALFERAGKKATLTSPGETLLGYARTVLRALQDADQALTALKGASVGRATIGVISTAKYIVPHLLAHFRAEHPGVALDLRDGNRREILASLERGEVDLAVMGRPPESADVTASSFAAHPSVIIAPPGHVLGGTATVPASVLIGEPFISREEGSGTRQLMERYFQAAGLAPRIAMTSSSNETIKQAVMAGMGVALISRHTIGLELRIGLLRILPVEGFPLMREWFVVHRRGMPLLPVHTQLRDFLIGHGQMIIDGLEQDPATRDDRIKATTARPDTAQSSRRQTERRRRA